MLRAATRGAESATSCSSDRGPASHLHHAAVFGNLSQIYNRTIQFKYQFIRQVVIALSDGALFIIIIKSKIVEKTNLPLNVGNNILFPKYIIIFLKLLLESIFFKYIISALNVKCLFLYKNKPAVIKVSIK